MKLLQGMLLRTLNYMSLPTTFSNIFSFLNEIPDEGSNCSLGRKVVCACWYEEFKLDSSIWCVSTTSGSVNASPMITRRFFIDTSAFGLSAGESTWQAESGVKGSWRDEKDSSMERLLAGVHSLAALSSRGHSEVGAGVAGSVLLSDSGQLSSDKRAKCPEPGASEWTPLSRCCSSIIFFKYLPCASIRNCSCLCTCRAFTSSAYQKSCRPQQTSLPPFPFPLYMQEYFLKHGTGGEMVVTVL